MKHLVRRSPSALVVALGLLGACSSSSDKPVAGGAAGAPAGGGGTTGSSVPTGTVGNATSCAKSQIELVFKPMYSAYDGKHTFQVPVIVTGIDPTTIVWSASDKSMVDIVGDTSTGGALLTTRKAGTVDIIATAGTLCGTSTLNITAAAPTDWDNGDSRYNNGVKLPTGGRPQGPRDGGVAVDAPARGEAACTNCHGETATNSQFRTIAHTPLQTAGFSDNDLAGIVTMGKVPDGGYFDETIVSKTQWSGFHKWTLDADDIKGIIVYLRALPPGKQTGTRADFGGMRPDGGGGGMRPDGGGMRDRDGGGGMRDRDGGGGQDRGPDAAQP